jgi:hypothetical protein
VPLDLSVALFYASLGLSAAAVVVFVWLMREPQDREDTENDRKS